jgi:hypothetical protein
MNENSDQNRSEQVCAILGVEKVDFEAKCLGLLTPGGRIRRGLYIPSTQPSSCEFLSAARKEALIKSVAQALPSVFELLLNLCDELMKQVRAFWWGAENGRRKVQWIPWEKLVLPKGLGGMGFKDLRLMNQSMLDRQAWRLVANPDRLIVSVRKC